MSRHLGPLDARLARREGGGYAPCQIDEQRSQPGCIGVPGGGVSLPTAVELAVRAHPETED